MKIPIKIKRYRLLQLITGFHYIHHLTYSFGLKIPFVKIGIFKKFGLKRLNKIKYIGVNGEAIKNSYHNCTLTNKY